MFTCTNCGRRSTKRIKFKQTPDGLVCRAVKWCDRLKATHDELQATKDEIRRGGREAERSE